MVKRYLWIGISAAICASPCVGFAQEWVSVAKADSREAFVDPASISLVGNTIEVRAKENFTSAQPSAKKDKTYLSSLNTYRVDCATRKLAFKEMQAFPEAELQGKVVQKAKYSDKNLQWMDAPEDTVFGELLDYTCEHAPAAAAVAPTG
jgi:hypothetical protein